MAKKDTQKPIEHYTHTDKERVNNPPVGLVTPKTDPEKGDKQSYQYDPHLDPQLQWAGKAEHLSFDVPTVSLHVHERIDAKTIIDTVKKARDDGGQMSLFDEPKPLREALAFYQHKENWSNRLVAGDSLLVMNSLLEKEGMAGKVQCVYFDPPYGIKYGSNFQPFVNKRDVKDGKDEDLCAEPEMLKAFRDTWELGIHSYLTYLRDRLLLARELLAESGSIFVQISDENVHHVREIMDEVFGVGNFVALIPFRKKTMPLGATFVEQMNDFLLFYGKNKEALKSKYRQLYFVPDVTGDFHWKWYELPNGSRFQMTDEQLNNHALLPNEAKTFRLVSMWPPTYSPNSHFEVEYNGEKYLPPIGACYPSNSDGMKRLVKSNRIEVEGKYLRYVMYAEDNLSKINAYWGNTVGAREKRYVVQTSDEVVKRCLLMTTDPSDLVLDITCGSGTTAYVAEQWGRRWITCDTSRIALALAKQRLMTANFDYYQLARPREGISSGFVYKTVPHITLKSIANNEPPATETLVDQPLKETNKTRVTGPFTVEAVPAPYAKSLDAFDHEPSGADSSIARSGETHRQGEWRDELLKTGVRAKNGVHLRFSRVETLSGAKHLQAQAETQEDTPKKVLLVFGPEHAPLAKRMVESAIDEARFLKPDLLLFCAFVFEEEAAKDIDETPEALLGFKLLKAQMNADLLTDDLRKKRASNESFWLIGQPDVQVTQLPDGKLQVEVLGFDYYNPKTGNVESGGKKNIALWMLDTDYDGRSLFPKQVFFPMAGNGEGWDRLARNLKAEIDEEKIEAFGGTVSLPFAKADKIAVKIIDDRGIESLRVISL
ncbi:MAG: DNA methyltransferase [Methylovulum sp.]|uniref:site-specific DNA-methyltransferase n=1 Tax=Methylovulum sp. TaxID=1916980 RepID=UPI002621A2F1|nr:DNA methyltransferase [Methylovulum sp.]MDD2725599.1 DNA methyltransferase [Methylovulum sp.]MDD5125652.1 DNA methyltransferase [Methylovulum sp.]